MASIELERLPNHVVIIPDGNRRWAAEHHLKPWEGHEFGAKNTEQLVREALRMGIRELSFWGSSIENLKKRPVAESRELLRIYQQHFEDLIKSDDIHRHRVHIRFIGRWEEQFPNELKDVMYRCLQATSDYDGNFLNFFLAYSGDDEMKLAIRKIADNLHAGEEVTDSMIKRHLMTNDMPPVDFLIRTGGEPHLSAGFMMWDIANSQLFFSESFYPDFGPKAFEEAITDYAMRGRRFGK
jgi:undecaprenyl diphosphate synthase